MADAFADRLFRAVPALRQEWEKYLESHQGNAAAGLEPPNLGVFLLMLAEQSALWFHSRDPALAARLDALLGSSSPNLVLIPRSTS